MNFMVIYKSKKTILIKLYFEAVNPYFKKIDLKLAYGLAILWYHFFPPIINVVVFLDFYSFSWNGHKIPSKITFGQWRCD